MEVIEKFVAELKVNLSAKSLAEFASIFEYKEFEKDEIILEQGQVSRYMYMVRKGMLRQFYYKDGRDITEHFSAEGDVVMCLESLFLAEPTNLMVEALEPSSVYQINYASWRKLCTENDEINLLLIRYLEIDLTLSQRKADSWRFENSNERYTRFCREYPEVAKRAPVAHIATYLLMTPETLSRVRANSL